MQKFDEMYTQLPYEFFTQGAKIRDHYKIYDEWLARQPGDMMAKRREEAEMIFRRVGIYWTYFTSLLIVFSWLRAVTQGG